MRSALTLLAIAVVGLFGATSIGFAAYIVSRDSVGLPVTKLKVPTDRLAPKPAQRKASRPKARPKPATTGRTTPAPPPAPTTTVESGDDHGGGGHSGKGRGGGDD